MQFLTTEQALADYAVLIRHLKAEWNAEKSPVIAFGGSYGGMLSAWFRLKYPNIVNGAIAASAPILQFYGTGVTEWVFGQITTDDFTDVDTQCSDTIRSAFVQMQQLSYNPSGLSRISQAFQLCTPLQNSADFNNFVNWIEGGIEYMAMIDYPYPNNFLMPVPGYPVTVACNNLKTVLNQGGDAISGLVAAINVYYNYTGSAGSCYNTSSQTTNDLGTYAWDYQTCTEMVMPMSTNGTSDMFLPSFWDENSWVEYCQQAWGVTPRPNWITTYFGGDLLPNGQPNIVGSNIVFSNGQLDPWRGGGVQTSLSDSLVAVIIEDGAHHLDLRGNNAADPDSVIQARKLEINHIQKWINEARSQ